MDAFLGLADGTVAYYQNDGSFTARGGTLNPLNGVDVGYFSFPSFSDVDGDGKVDALIGEVFGKVQYYRNENGQLIEQSGNTSFDRVDVGFYAAPSLADVDGDGDVDAAIGGDISLRGDNRGRISFLETIPLVGTASLTEAFPGDEWRGSASLTT
ncbi:MAG: FG-GAP-like repeat-containing protein [Cyanophyceae cyanobacterium]